MNAPGHHPIRLGELAERFGLRLEGDGELAIRGIATLERATPDQLGFLANPAYLPQLEQTRAGAVVLSQAHAERFAGSRLISVNPYADWARLAAFVQPLPVRQPAVHPSAVIGEDCRIGAEVDIGPLVSIGRGCQIGTGCRIGAGSVLDDGVRLGADCELVGRVYIGRDCELGERVIVHPGAVIGADGFGLALDQGRWLKVPQLGRVRIGNDCEIGANTTIDRGAIDDTVLEEDVRLDNQVQVAHNVHIGAHTAIAGCVGIAGSTRIGRYCMIAGASGIGGHLNITDRVVITAMSTVLDSIDQPGEYGSGIPARPHGAWKRILVRLGQLDDWARRLRRLERSDS